QRPAEDREVLGEDEDLAAEDRAVAGDDRVAPGAVLAHPELDLAVADVAVELDERPRVEQLLEPLAGEQPALVPPACDRLLRPLVTRLVAQRAHRVELPGGRLVGHRRSLTPLLGSLHAAAPPARAPGARLPLPLDGDLLDAV